MNEIGDEIILTLNLMQTYIDEVAHSELQGHLYSLLEMKRNELHKRLTECSCTGSTKPAPAPLTVDELMEGGWWCGDISEECANVFKSKGLSVYNSSEWGTGNWLNCGMDEGDVTRWVSYLGSRKQIHRIGNDFYWSENETFN